MNQSGHPRELTISQQHTGTLLLAGLMALAGTCLVGVLSVASVLWFASRSMGAFCLLLPVILLVMFSGIFLLHWGENNLPRLWPSGNRLTLDGAALTLKRRHTIKSQMRWDEPFTALRWRVRQTEGKWEPNQLCLACQLEQRERSLCVYTDASSQDWRRVPGWRQFSLLENALHPGRIEPLTGLAMVPSRHGADSRPQADPRTLQLAERQRRQRGWALSYEDFCAVMAVVKGALNDKQD
jgi:hypothetical protein